MTYKSITGERFINPHIYTTICALFYQNVLNFPDTLALVCAHQPSHLYGVPSVPLENGKRNAAYLRWTYRDHDCAIREFANGLRSRGLQSGDSVLISMTNTAEYIIESKKFVEYPGDPAYVTNREEGLRLRSQ